MKRTWKTLFAIAVLSYPLSAMAWGLDDIGQDQQDKQDALSTIRKSVDDACPIDPKSKNHWDLRYIRAQLILAVITRYGAARIEDYYGGERDVRSAYLLAKVNTSVEAIRNAALHSGDKVALHNVELADVTESLLRSGAAAMKATTDKIKDFAFAPNWNDGSKFFTNALQDALYEDAYKTDCAELMNEGTDASKIPKIKAVVNAHLVKQCDRLQAMNGLPHKCADLVH